MSSLARRFITVLTVAGALVLPLAPRVAEAHWRDRDDRSAAVDLF